MEHRTTDELAVERAHKKARKEQDYLRLVKSGCHLGSVNVNSAMERFVSHRIEQTTPVFNLEHTYNKIRLAARFIAGIPNREDVLAISSRNLGQRAVIKFAKTTGCQATSDARWTPGVLTNYETKKFQEPRMLVVVDPYADRKAIVEASYMNIPVIALCNTDSNLQFVDVAIPCNNRSTESISMIFWLLAREVRVLAGLQTRDEEFDTLVDLFYYKDLEKQEQDELRALERARAEEEAQGDDQKSWEEGEDVEADGDGGDWAKE